jgi:hypothetical protein
MLLGIDFSFGGGLTAAQIKAAGYHYVCRYLSGGNSKDISAAEVANYKAAGIPVVFVWETTGNEYTQAQGVTDAKAAEAELARVGATGATVFFAQDVPVAAGTNPVAYMRGVNGVIGLARSGGYGQYSVIKSLFDSGVIRYGWQTSGGSGGAWDPRADIRQVSYNVHVGPATVDVNQAAFWHSIKVLGPGDDFGQWPRPGAAPPAPVPAGDQFAAPAHLAEGTEVIRNFTWSAPPAVGGSKTPSGYTLEAVQDNGVIVPGAVSGTTGTIKLHRGWQYEIRVWADGGSVAPPHASLRITA